MGKKPRKRKKATPARRRPPLQAKGDGSRASPANESHARIPKWLYGLLSLVVAVPIVWWALSRTPVQRSGDETGRVTQTTDDGIAPARSKLTITYPLDGAMFPPEIVPPTVCWEDADSATNRWSLEVEFAATGTPGGVPVESMQCVVDAPEWTPTDCRSKAD